MKHHVPQRWPCAAKGALGRALRRLLAVDMTVSKDVPPGVGLLADPIRARGQSHISSQSCQSLRSRVRPGLPKAAYHRCTSPQRVGPAPCPPSPRLYHAPCYSCPRSAQDQELRPRRVPLPPPLSFAFISSLPSPSFSFPSPRWLQPACLLSPSSPSRWAPPRPTCSTSTIGATLHP